MESNVSKNMDERIQEKIETEDDIVIDNRTANPDIRFQESEEELEE
jgi:hypothetical protein